MHKTNSTLSKFIQKIWGKPRSSSMVKQRKPKARFHLLCGISNEMSSVIDFGCGLGAFYDFIKHKEPNISYLGIDCVPEFIG